MKKNAKSMLIFIIIVVFLFLFLNNCWKNFNCLKKSIQNYCEANDLKVGERQHAQDKGSLLARKMEQNETAVTNMAQSTSKRTASQRDVVRNKNQDAEGIRSGIKERVGTRQHRKIR